VLNQIFNLFFFKFFYYLGLRKDLIVF